MSRPRLSRSFQDGTMTLSRNGAGAGSLTGICSGAGCAPAQARAARSPSGCRCRTSRFSRAAGRSTRRYSPARRRAARFRRRNDAERAFRAPARGPIGQPGELGSGAAQLHKTISESHADPEHGQLRPAVIGEQLERIGGDKNQRDPFRHHPQEKFDVRIDRRKSDEDGEVDRRGTGQPGAMPESPDGQEHRRHEEEQRGRAQ